MSVIHSLSTQRTQRLLAAAAVGAALGIPALAQADSVNLGTAANYAVLGFNGVQDSFTDVTINGNVGVAGSSSLSMATSAHVNGNVLVNAGTSFHDNATPSHNISGSLLTGQNLSAAVTDAENAFSFYTGLTATENLSGVSAPLTIAGNGGTNVIDINGNITNAITLTGGANDLFVLNVSGNINLTGTESILAGAGISPNQIVINLEGTHQFNTGDFNIIDGTVIAPNASGDLTSVNGRVFFGGSSLQLMCGGVVNQPPAVPLPPTAWGALTLMAGLGTVRVLGKRLTPVPA